MSILNEIGAFFLGVPAKILTFIMGAIHALLSNQQLMDMATAADTLKQTSTSTTSCTLSGTVVSSDVIIFHAEGY